MPSSDLNVGDVVVYVPDHANGLITHKDCELGFVTGFTDEKNVAFCRYFFGSVASFVKNQDTPEIMITKLRTLANSEATPANRLIKLNGVFSRESVLSAIGLLGYDTDEL